MKRSILFAVFVAFAAPASAQSIGAGAGIVKLEQDDESSLFLTGNLRIGLLGPIVLEPEVGYWKRTEPVGTGEATFEDLSLGANGLLVVGGDKLELFGGVGLGAHFLDRSAGIAGIIRDSKSTDVAVHVLGGVDFKLSGALNAFGVVRRDVFGDASDARDQTKFYAGLRLKF